jgi:hypothetical protein
MARRWWRSGYSTKKANARGKSLSLDSPVMPFKPSEVARIYLPRARVNEFLLTYSRAVDLRIRRAGRPQQQLPLQARGLPLQTLRRTARLFARDLGES